MAPCPVAIPVIPCANSPAAGAFCFWASIAFLTSAASPVAFSASVAFCIVVPVTRPAIACPACPAPWINF